VYQAITSSQSPFLLDGRVQDRRDPARQVDVITTVSQVEENVPHAAVVPVSLRWHLDWQDMGGPGLQCCRSFRREQVAGQVAEDLDQNWQLRLQEGYLVRVQQLPCTRVQVVQAEAVNIFLADKRAQPSTSFKFTLHQGDRFFLINKYNYSNDKAVFCVVDKQHKQWIMRETEIKAGKEKTIEKGISCFFC
jgi:hypothetical protein